MSPQARNHQEQFNLFDQPEAMQAITPTPDAPKAPESSYSVNKGIPKAVGAVALETPLKVELSTRREAMLDVIDALDVIESTESHAAAIAEKNDPSKPFAYGYHKALKRKGMTAEKLEDGNEQHQSNKKKADEAFDTMWGREVVEKHGNELGAPIEGRPDVSATDVVMMHYSRDKEGYGRVVQDGTNMVRLPLADNTVEEFDQGRVVEEGFVKKYSAGDHINPVAHDRMTPTSKPDAKRKRNELRKELKAQMKVEKRATKAARPAAIKHMATVAIKLAKGATENPKLTDSYRRNIAVSGRDNVARNEDSLANTGIGFTGPRNAIRPTRITPIRR